MFMQMLSMDRSAYVYSFIANVKQKYCVSHECWVGNRNVDGQSRGYGLKTTVDHALIRGLITAGPDASRSFLCLGTSVGPKSGC